MVYKSAIMSPSNNRNSIISMSYWDRILLGVCLILLGLSLKRGVFFIMQKCDYLFLAVLVKGYGY